MITRFPALLWAVSVLLPGCLFAFQICSPAWNSVVPRNILLHEVSRTGSTIYPSSSSQLAMGIMEDFLSGQDSSKRESDNRKYLKSLQKRVENINALEAEIEDLDDDELEAKTSEFQARLKSGEDINGKLLEEAFAVVREAAWCVLNILFYRSAFAVFSRRTTLAFRC
jgi:hypothetical protein